MTNFQRVLFFKRAFLKTKTHNFISYIVDNSVFDHLPPYLKKKVFLKIWQKSQKNTYTKVSFLIKLQAYNFKKQTLAQVFSWEFCKLFKNTSLREHLQTTASVKQSDMD